MSHASSLYGSGLSARRLQVCLQPGNEAYIGKCLNLLIPYGEEGGTLPGSSALGPTTGARYQKSTCGRSFRPVQVLVFILTREA